MATDNIKVAIRVRRLIQKELAAGLKSHWDVEENTIYCTENDSNGRKIPPYSFDRVFSDSCVTMDIFEDVCKPIVDSALAGFNGTLFAYGQSSSGKTFTMSGSKIHPGVISLAVDEIFTRIENIPDREFLIRVGYLEIYKEKVSDLLNTEAANLKLQEDTDRNIQVVGLTEELVKNTDNVFEVLRRGDANRHTAETKQNDRSSRSHCILRFVIESRKVGHEDDAVMVSNLYFVDLAGSEKAGENSGDRFREGCSINKSLFTLGMVIRKLSGDINQQHVSFRDSKLTRILQNALGGNSRTAIICTITPAHIDESESTLKFASRAKNITNKPTVNEVMSDAAMLKQYRLKMKKLEQQIANMNTASISIEKAELEKQLEEKDRVERQQADMIAKLQEMIVISGTPQICQEPPKKKRRETWCPGKAKAVLQAIPEFSPPHFKSYRSDRRSDRQLPPTVTEEDDDSFQLLENIRLPSSSDFNNQSLQPAMDETIHSNPSVKELFELQDKHEILLKELSKKDAEFQQLEEFTQLERLMEAEQIAQLKSDLAKKNEEHEALKANLPWLEEELMKAQQERNSLRIKVESLNAKLNSVEDGTGITQVNEKLTNFETQVSDLSNDLQVQKSQYEFHIKQLKLKLETYTAMLEEKGVNFEAIKTRLSENGVNDYAEPSKVDDSDITELKAKHEREITELRNEVDLKMIAIDREKKIAEELRKEFDEELERQRVLYIQDIEDAREESQVYLQMLEEEKKKSQTVVTVNTDDSESNKEITEIRRQYEEDISRLNIELQKYQDMCKDLEMNEEKKSTNIDTDVESTNTANMDQIKEKYEEEIKSLQSEVRKYQSLYESVPNLTGRRRQQSFDCSIDDETVGLNLPDFNVQNNMNNDLGTDLHKEMMQAEIEKLKENHEREINDLKAELAKQTDVVRHDDMKVDTDIQVKELQDEIIKMKQDYEAEIEKLKSEIANHIEISNDVGKVDEELQHTETQTEPDSVNTCVEIPEDMAVDGKINETKQQHEIEVANLKEEITRYANKLEQYESNQSNDLQSELMRAELDEIKERHEIEVSKLNEQISKYEQLLEDHNKIKEQHEKELTELKDQTSKYAKLAENDNNDVDVDLDSDTDASEISKLEESHAAEIAGLKEEIAKYLKLLDEKSNMIAKLKMKRNKKVSFSDNVIALHAKEDIEEDTADVREKLSSINESMEEDKCDNTVRTDEIDKVFTDNHDNVITPDSGVNIHYEMKISEMDNELKHCYDEINDLKSKLSSLTELLEKERENNEKVSVSRNEMMDENELKDETNVQVKEEVDTSIHMKQFERFADEMSLKEEIENISRMSDGKDIDDQGVLETVDNEVVENEEDNVMLKNKIKELEESHAKELEVMKLRFETFLGENFETKQAHEEMKSNYEDLVETLKIELEEIKNQLLKLQYKHTKAVSKAGINVVQDQDSTNNVKVNYDEDGNNDGTVSDMNVEQDKKSTVEVKADDDDNVVTGINVVSQSTDQVNTNDNENRDGDDMDTGLNIEQDTQCSDGVKAKTDVDGDDDGMAKYKEISTNTSIFEQMNVVKELIDISVNTSFINEDCVDTDDMKKLRLIIEEKEKYLQDLQQTFDDAKTSWSEEKQTAEEMLEKRDESLQELGENMKMIEEKNSMLENQIKTLEDELQSTVEENSVLESRINELEGHIRIGKGMLEDKDDEIKTLKDNMNDIKDDLERDLQDKIEEMTSYVNDLEQKNNSNEAALRTANEKVSEMTEYVNEMEQKNESYEASLRTANENVAEMTTYINDLEQKNDDNNEALKSANEKIDELEQAAEQFSDKIISLESDLEFFKEKETTLNKMCTDYEEKIVLLEADLDTMKARTSDYDRLCNDLEIAQSNNVDVKSIQDQYNEQIQEYINKLTDSESQCKTLTAQYKDGCKQLETMSGELDVANKQVADLKTELEHLKKEKDELLVNLNNLQGTSDKLKQTEEKLELCVETIKELNEQIRTTEDEEAVLQAKILDLENDKKCLSKSMSDINDLKIKINSLEAEVGDKSTVISQNEQEIKLLKEKLTLAKSSTNTVSDAELNDLKMKMKEAEDKLLEIQTEKQTLMNDLENINSEKSQLQKKVEVLEEEKSSLEDDIVVLEKGLPVQVLKYHKQPENVDWENKWEAFVREEKIKRMAVGCTIKGLKKQLSVAQERQKNAYEEALKDVQESEREKEVYKKMEARIQKVDEEANALYYKLEDEKEKNRILTEKLDKLEAEHSTGSSSHSASQPKMNTLTDDHSCKYKLEAFSAKENMIEMKEELKKRVNQYESTINQYEERISHMKNQIRRLQSNMNDSINVCSSTKKLNFDTEIKEEKPVKSNVSSNVSANVSSSSFNDSKSKPVHGGSMNAGYIDHFKVAMTQAENKDLKKEVDKMRQKSLRYDEVEKENKILKQNLEKMKLTYPHSNQIEKENMYLKQELEKLKSTTKNTDPLNDSTLSTSKESGITFDGLFRKSHIESVSSPRKESVFNEVFKKSQKQKDTKPNEEAPNCQTS